MIDLLRRAWDTLDTFKQAYPENWNEQDEQVLEDLLKADLKLSGVELKWQGLTDDETERLIHNFGVDPHTLLDEVNARLQKRNT